MASAEPSVLIYALVDPRTKDVRYIGQTRKTLALRLAGHLNEALKPNRMTQCNPRKIEWIRELAREGCVPEIVTIRSCLLYSANGYERQEIAAHISAGCDLLNSAHNPSTWCRGGEECPANGHSVHTRVSHDIYIFLREGAAALGWNVDDYLRLVIEEGLGVEE